MITTTNAMGSGFEVESAAFHPPVNAGIEIETPRSGFRGRLDDLKSRSVSKVHNVQRAIGSNVSMQKDRVQTSMKTSPMLWAGIAAGSGFALGLLGRFVHWRNYHRRSSLPDLVIVDATC